MELGTVVHFDSASAFRRWLLKHHAESTQLWVGFWRKGTGHPSLTWEESVDEALCFGWIDGIRKRLDDESYAIRFTSRRPRSSWSRRNLERYTELTRLGLIAPSGAAAYERRTEEEAVVLSAEYMALLKANDAAWADWESRPPGYRRQVAHWVMSAKRESTRARRFDSLLEDCAAGRKVKHLR